MSTTNIPPSAFRVPRFTITVPSSTSNLGASFDTCGLALSLYLRLSVEPRTSGVEISLSGEGADWIPRDESNFIWQVANYVANERKQPLGGARLHVDSQIPLARGLGSSSSAIIAGISVYEVLTGERLSEAEFFRYAMHYETHGDNLAPSYLGGLVLACVRDEGEGHFALLAVKRHWPDEIKIAIVIPDFEMETAKMRAALPREIPLRDAIFNMQRAALLQAAIAEGRYDLLTEALRDRLHQPYRAPLVPALSEVLKLNDERDRFPGLLGVAISGAGSTMIAFTLGDEAVIAEAMQARIEACGIHARTMQVCVDNLGRTITQKESA
ncbi:MAG TPA: homoserine kinase [Blastocatellia bacterium]|nr:homoserine kinase [Blastocatellia bacterium]